VIVKALKDLPISAADVQAARRAHRVAIIIASEGSNHLTAPTQRSAADVAVRDTASKSITLQSIANYKSRGWLSTALAHVIGSSEAGHRLLRADDAGELNDFGRFVAAALMNQGILVDMPHMSMSVRNEILDIAELTSRPVMISHDTPRWLFDQPFGPETLARLARSGHGTGLVGVHSYKTYINPQTLASYAASIDEGRKAYDALPPQLGQGIQGDEHLALGLDWFFHKNMDLHDWAGRDPREPLKGLVAILMRPPYNYTDQQIKNILGENMIRMLREAWRE